MTEPEAPPHLTQTSDALQGRQEQWAGDTLFYLVFMPADGSGNVGIDVDEPGWVATHLDDFRRPGTWFLRDKRTMAPVFIVLIHEGDQFYFTKHHVGILNVAVETVAIGVGKKQADGQTVNLWLLPNGVICGGDDVDTVAIKMLGG